MERMGHSTVTVALDRYGHLLPALEARLDDALDRLAGCSGAHFFMVAYSSVRSHVGHVETIALPAQNQT